MNPIHYQTIIEFIKIKTEIFWNKKILHFAKKFTVARILAIGAKLLDSELSGENLTPAHRRISTHFCLQSAIDPFQSDDRPTNSFNLCPKMEFGDFLESSKQISITEFQKNLRFYFWKLQNFLRGTNRTLARNPLLLNSGYKERIVTIIVEDSEMIFASGARDPQNLNFSSFFQNFNPLRTFGIPTLLGSQHRPKAWPSRRSKAWPNRRSKAWPSPAGGQKPGPKPEKTSSEATIAFWKKASNELLKFWIFYKVW